MSHENREKTINDIGAYNKQIEEKWPFFFYLFIVSSNIINSFFSIFMAHKKISKKAIKILIFKY